MNDYEKKAADEAHGCLAAGFGGSDLSRSNIRGAGNKALQSNATAQGTQGAHRQSEKAMALPVLAEMGDIAPALEILLRLQAEYARGEPGVSRAMRDVAYSALAAEIRNYVEVIRKMERAHASFIDRVHP